MPLRKSLEQRSAQEKERKRGREGWREAIWEAIRCKDASPGVGCRSRIAVEREERETAQHIQPA